MTDNENKQPTAKARVIAADFKYLKEELGDGDIAIELLSLMVKDSQMANVETIWGEASSER